MRKIIGAALLLCIFVSSAYIVHEAVCHHDCAGENCPICQFIAQIEQLRRGFGMALLALLLICFMLIYVVVILEQIMDSIGVLFG